MTDFIKKLIPPHIFFSLVLVFTTNFFVYYGARLINLNRFHHNIETAFDSEIPFISAFVLIYVISYIEWVIGYYIICRDGKELCYDMMSKVIIAKLCCFVVFVIFPTTMTRPEILSNDFLSRFGRFIYSVDIPDNLFPSMHCMESWLCFRGAARMKNGFKWYTVITFFFFIFVCFSTVFVKQHVVIDIIGGIIAGELGIFIGKLTKAEKPFSKAVEKLSSLIH